MYSPPRDFVKRLKSLDNRLGCYYNGEHGHFVINYERAHGGSVPVLLVEGHDGGFRWPDDRDIDALRRADKENSSTRERLQRAAKHMEDYREAKRRAVASDIRHMTRSNLVQLDQATRRVTGDGKANAAFRRIKQKAKGIAFG